jgi:RHS repeat-associated protein
VPSGSTLAYDAENRLLSASGTSFAADYDADGLRTYKATGATTPLSNGYRFYVYDGDRRMLELDSSGDVVQANGWAADGLRDIYYANGDNHYYQFTYDPEGNVSQQQGQSNTSTYCLNTSVYDAYGKLLHKGGSSPSNESGSIGFAGEWGGYTDVDQSNSSYTTGLVEMGHRYYDSAYGRFLNRDPIGYNGGINLYGFAGNDPVTKSDPNGTNAFTDWLNQRMTDFTMFLGRPIMKVLASGTTFDHSKQPTFADANRDNPAAQAIRQGGQVVNKQFLPMAAGTLALAVIGAKLGAVIEDMIPYGSGDSGIVAALRMDKGDWSGNYAVARYGPGADDYVVARSGGGLHAEYNLISELAKAGKTPEDVTDVYSEFEPCSTKRMNCAKMLEQYFPNARVTYSFKYNGIGVLAGRLARAQAFAALRNL